MLTSLNSAFRAGSISASVLYKYLTSEVKYEEEAVPSEAGGETLIRRATAMQALAETFQSYGGVLAKLAQMLCYDDESNTAFSECRPASVAPTIEYLKKVAMLPPLKDNVSINYEVYKSGSIGQVHKATRNGEKLVIKVRYAGLAEQVKTDIFILEKVSKLLFGFADFHQAMIDIRSKLTEELDYTTEIKNQQTIHQIFSTNKYIHIPEVYPALSTDAFIVMEQIEGQSLGEFIETARQSEKNLIAISLVSFIFTALIKHKIYYSDIHYGNFLVKRTPTPVLCVTDFGCLHYVREDILQDILAMYKSILLDDRPAFFEAAVHLEVYDPETIPEFAKDYLWEYISLQMLPWTTPHFVFTKQYSEESKYKKTEIMKHWKIPADLVYFMKIPYCMVFILTKLNAEGDFKAIVSTLVGQNS